MKETLKEELNQIKYLFDYKKGVVISEQETTPVATTPTTQQTTTPEAQGGDGCQQVEIKSPSFSNAQADHTKFVEPMTTKLNELISQNPAFKGGTITKMEIIGGASNVDGGKVTSFSLTNDYTPVEPKNTSGTGYQNNIKYATKRGELAKTTLLPILTGADYGLKIGFDPVVTPAVIDTGGVQDSNTNRKPNPGQIVIIRMTVCPVTQQKTTSGEEIPKLPYLKPTLIPILPKDVPLELAPLWECFNGVEIDINFDRNSGQQGHNCSSAVWDMSANDVTLYRNSRNGQKVPYASLNNYTNASNPNFVDKYDDGVKQGKYRFNKFTIDEITAKEFINLGSLQKYQGQLEIFMKCQVGKSGDYGLPGHSSSGGGCHDGTASIVVKTKEGPVEEQIQPPVQSGEKSAVYTVPACSGIYKRLVSQGVFDGNGGLRQKDINNADPTGALRQMVNYQQLPQDVRSNIQKVGQALQK